MNYVYRIRSDRYPAREYTGCTSDLKSRLAHHNDGCCDYTRPFKPWKVVWYAAFETEEKVFQQSLRTPLLLCEEFKNGNGFQTGKHPAYSITDMSENRIKGLLLDLSGTLYADDEPITGAKEAMRALRAAGIRILFVTNTTSKSRRRILARLEQMGFALRLEEIFTAPLAAARVLCEAGHQRCHFLLPAEALEDLSAFEATDDNPDAVVIGDIGDGFDYATLSRCFDLLMHGAEFYALAANRFYESGGQLKLDVGPFVAALEYACQSSAKLIGKPSNGFYRAATALLQSAPGSVAMVGDDIESDVGGAMDAGLTGILVRTGKYRKSVAEKSKIRPHHTIDSVADLPDILGL